MGEYIDFLDVAAFSPTGRELEYVMIYGMIDIFDMMYGMIDMIFDMIYT
jgi:hypothetical protein